MNYSKRPGEHECFGFHRDYVAKVPDGNIVETLQSQLATVPAFILAIPPEQLTVTHAPYGWKIHTVLEHCCDAERVFGYRALRFATGDKTELPGWDENHYASSAYGDALSTDAMAEEFSALRSANICLLSRLSAKCWNEMGTADGRQMSVRTLAWLMAGHWLHHEAILGHRLAGAGSGS